MTTFEIISLLLGGGGFITVLGMAFSMGRIFQNIHLIGIKLEKIDAKLDKLETEIKTQGECLSHIEGYILGRDFRRTGTGNQPSPEGERLFDAHSD